MNILVFDIETAPIVAYVWGLHDQNIALNQIVEDSYVLAWAAKWYGSPVSETIYRDCRSTPGSDKGILLQLRALLDRADIVITQNGRKFDSRKLNARFLVHGMRPPKPYRHLDTLEITRKVASFTSHKLEYLSDKLNTKYKKLKHEEFPGFDLWRECLAGNKKAWDAMKKYNIHDVLATEELYTKVQAWDGSINFAAYHAVACCGALPLLKPGYYAYTTAGKYRRYQCLKCGKWSRDTYNLLSPEFRKLMLRTAA